MSYFGEEEEVIGDKKWNEQVAASKFAKLKGFGKAEEVAEAVAFFASPASSYITGDVLNVNGGLYT